MWQNIEKMRYSDKIPYVFVLEYLTEIAIVIKPMFGCYAIYVDAKFCLFLLSRNKPLLPNGRSEQNGIYAVTTVQHIDTLKKDFPLAEFDLLKSDKVWMFLAEGSSDFEKYAIKACELISAFDSRIGR